MLTGYAGLPFGEISQCEAGNVGVLGVPSEVDSGPRMGASLAPDALRKMSQQLEDRLACSWPGSWEFGSVGGLVRRIESIL